jgi:hypothetical protein
MKPVLKALNVSPLSAGVSTAPGAMAKRPHEHRRHKRCHHPPAARQAGHAQPKDLPLPPADDESLDGSTANRDGDDRQRPVIPVEVLRPAGREVVEQPSTAHLRIDCIFAIASLIPASSEGTSPACSVD